MLGVRLAPSLNVWGLFWETQFKIQHKLYNKKNKRKTFWKTCFPLRWLHGGKKNLMQYWCAGWHPRIYLLLATQMPPFDQNIPQCNIKSYQASQSWLAPANLNQRWKAHVVKLLRIFLPKSFGKINHLHTRQTPQQANIWNDRLQVKLWLKALNFDLSYCGSRVTYHCHKRWYFPLGQRQPKHNVTQPCPQTVHQNGVLQFKWTVSCGPLLSEHETADTCWVVKVSRPDWRAIVLVSSGSNQPLSPVMFIISISIFKGVDAGQRWQPF